MKFWIIMSRRVSLTSASHIPLNHLVVSNERHVTTCASTWGGKRESSGSFQWHCNPKLWVVALFTCRGESHASFCQLISKHQDQEEWKHFFSILEAGCKRSSWVYFRNCVNGKFSLSTPHRVASLRLQGDPKRTQKSSNLSSAALRRALVILTLARAGGGSFRWWVAREFSSSLHCLNAFWSLEVKWEIVEFFRYFELWNL